MPLREINVNDQMNLALSRAAEGIFAATTFGSLGERFGLLSPDVELPRGTPIIELRVAPSDTDPSSFNNISREALTQFSNYAIRYSIVAMITACESYLHELRLITMFTKKVCDTGPITSGELRSLRQDWIDSSWKLGGIEILSKALENLNESIELISRRDEFIDINKIRRVLVHRGGKVGEQDVSASTNLLIVSWKRTRLLVNNAEISHMPAILPAGGLLQGTRTRGERFYRIGDVIDLTARDSQDIAQTLIEFCEEAHNKTVMVANALFKRRRSVS